MSVGIGIIGRDITFTLGGSALVGVNSKGFTFNNEALDTTDDNSSGWQERLATPGLKSVEFTFSGIVKNLELIAAYAGTSQIFPVVATYPDGSTWTGDFFMDSVSATGESNGLTTFDASFSSSGAQTFVAGT
jgi:predicted secreted protein